MSRTKKSSRIRTWTTCRCRCNRLRITWNPKRRCHSAISQGASEPRFYFSWGACVFGGRYETFERDPVKYRQYEAAVHAALLDTPKTKTTVVMVVRACAVESRNLEGAHDATTSGVVVIHFDICGDTSLPGGCW